MKRTAAILMLALLLLSALLVSCADDTRSLPEVPDDTSGSAETTVPEETTEAPERFPDVTVSPKLEEGKYYEAHGVELLTIPTPDSGHHVVQGGYFTGEYYFIAFIQSDDPEPGVLIGKYSADGTLLKMSDPLPLDHANNIAYYSKEHKLLVSHCQSNAEDRTAWYSFVDPDTLEVVSTGVLEHPSYAVGYSAERDRFGSGEGDGNVIDVWNENLKLIGSYFVKRADTLSQGVWCDSDYIWFVRSARNGAEAELRLYDWDGGFAYSIPIRDVPEEQESISIQNGEIICICNTLDYNGAKIYRLDLSETEAPET